MGIEGIQPEEEPVGLPLLFHLPQPLNSRLHHLRHEVVLFLPPPRPVLQVLDEILFVLLGQVVLLAPFGKIDLHRVHHIDVRKLSPYEPHVLETPLVRHPGPIHRSSVGYQGGRVPPGAQSLGQGDILRLQVLPSPPHQGVLAREEGRPHGKRGHPLGVSPLEDRGSPSELVQIRSPDPGVPVETQMVRPQAVEHYHDDVHLVPSFLHPNSSTTLDTAFRFSTGVP